MLGILLAIQDAMIKRNKSIPLSSWNLESSDGDQYWVKNPTNMCMLKTVIITNRRGSGHTEIA